MNIGKWLIPMVFLCYFAVPLHYVWVSGYKRKSHNLLYLRLSPKPYKIKFVVFQLLRIVVTHFTTFEAYYCLVFMVETQYIEIYYFPTPPKPTATMATQESISKQQLPAFAKGVTIIFY